MRFAAFSSQVALVLLTIVAALVVLLYLLKPRTRRVVVSSTLLWGALAGRQGRARRWRWALSILLASCTALSIALALTRPQLPAIGGFNKRLLLILDDSPSMAARTLDGKSRWRHAVERARAVVERAGAGSQVMVLDTMGAAASSGFVSPGAALADVGRLAPAFFGSARLPPLPAGSMEIHMFSDGVSALGPAKGAIDHSVFEPANNVAVTAFEARPLPNDPTRYQALVQILNASPVALAVKLVITGAPQYQLARELVISAGDTVDEIFDVTQYAEGMLRAEVHAQADAFDRDDFAYTLVLPHRPRRVLVVTEGNAFLEDSIRSLPGVQVTMSSPSAYRPSPVFDAYVFDRFAPRAPPPAGALVFRAPGATWLTAMPKEVNNPSVTGWDDTYPVTAGVAWRDIRIRRAQVAAVGAADSLVLVKGSAHGALVIAGNGSSPWIEVGFALQDSNFALQPGFPVFLGNALSWLADGPGFLSRGLGSIEVPLIDAEVRDRHGHAVAVVRVPGGTVFQANRPDVYTITSAGKRSHVVANVLDPDYAQINRSRFADQAPEPAPAVARHRWSSVEPWILLLLLGAVLLIVDWLTFSRRITV